MDRVIVFQFHFDSTGTIPFYGLLLLIFVSIPLWFDWDFELIIAAFGLLRFNSTLIRLGPCCPVIFSWIVFKFQFHFDSTGTTKSLWWSNSLFVSIPLWFDWDFTRGMRLPSIRKSFNSTLIRLGQLLEKSISELGLFQFHFDSTGTLTENFEEYMDSKFQFHFDSTGTKNGEAINNYSIKFQFHFDSTGTYWKL